MCNPSHDGLHHDDDTISLCVSVTVENKFRSACFGKHGVNIVNRHDTDKRCF